MKLSSERGWVRGRTVANNYRDFTVANIDASAHNFKVTLNVAVMALEKHVHTERGSGKRTRIIRKSGKATAASRDRARTDFVRAEKLAALAAANQGPRRRRRVRANGFHHE